MRKTREILRQRWELGRTHREIAASVGQSLGAVATTLGRAQAAGLDWARTKTLNDTVLEELLYGSRPEGTARPMLRKPYRSASTAAMPCRMRQRSLRGRASSHTEGVEGGASRRFPTSISALTQQSPATGSPPETRVGIGHTFHDSSSSRRDLPRDEAEDSPALGSR